MAYNFEKFMDKIRTKNPGQAEFHQAVQEVMEVLIPFVNQEYPHYEQNLILERLCQPDRIIEFPVLWRDDQGFIQMNRGYRVQFSNHLGPYKGGLRFHPSVNISVLKFLGFEQILKNSLTTLPLGGAKGGADFDPKDRSSNEILSFCQSFMTELYRHIGDDVDVPAGDIGVGAREIGYLFGQYKKIRNVFHGVLTGKSLSFGGSLIRPEATGYGCLYFVEAMLARKGRGILGMRAVVSGSGNVAQYAAEKLLAFGAKVLTLSDSSGTLHDPEGFNEEKLDHMRFLKEVKRARVSEYLKKYPNSEFLEGKKPWHIPCDLAFPCATQNELEVGDAILLSQNGCQLVAEGANMPTTAEAVAHFQSQGVAFAPGKAANAGGVSVSGLEMAQNSTHSSWDRETVDRQLRKIMGSIHDQCMQYGKELPGGQWDYVQGANLGGFVKIAEAMLAMGV